MAHNNNAFDCIIIGAGVAGMKAAQSLGSRGWRVALIEKGRLGGTCLNCGCDPTKTLHRCAEIAYSARNGARFGIRTSQTEVDFAQVMDRVQRTIQGFLGSDPVGKLRECGVETIFGEARFSDPHTISVNGDTLNSERFIICTGGSPVIPDMEGLSETDYLTNENVFDLKELPRRMVFLGGGEIGCELGQIFSRLGSEVTVLERGDHLLAGEDPEIASALEIHLRREGLCIFTNVEAQGVCAKTDCRALNATVKGHSEQFEFDKLVVCVGRKPNVRGLNLSAAGVEATDLGIGVNDELQTTAPHIWACGDVTGHPNYTNVATYHAEVALENMIDNAHRKIDESAIPWAVYTDPGVAHVELTEEQAREAGHETCVARVEAGNLPRAQTDEEQFGITKLVVDAQTDKVLGATLLCLHAGEIINEIALAIRAGVTQEILAETVHAYPTMAQVVLSLARRAQPVGA